MNAYSGGTDVTVKKNEDAVVGEQGVEGLVRDGKFTPIGVNGAEVIPLKQGDIIFNAKQTEALLKNGHINSRGKTIGGYANGTVPDIKWNTDVLKNIDTNILYPKMNVPNYSNIVPKNTEVIISQNIDVTLPNVTNETGFKNFEKQLMQMKNDALQRSYRRN